MRQNPPAKQYSEESATAAQWNPLDNPLAEFQALLASSVARPRWSNGFVRFARELCGVDLTPAQYILTAVAFDGAEPRDFTGGEREIARRLFGDVETIPESARHVLVAVCGARGGKSYVLGSLRLLHLALTVPLTTLAPGELAVALIVAPDMRLAHQVLRYALGAAEAVPEIKAMITANRADGFTLRRPDGRTVSIECLPATRGGSAVRGRSLVGALLDESAFFRDEGYQINDAELYRAVAPRVLRGGQVIVASTPWAEAGLLFDFYRRNFGTPTDAICAHAPTLLLRDDEHTRLYVQRERARDPANASREFDAEFMPSGTGTFFDSRAIKGSTDEALVLPVKRDPNWYVSIGADFGFRSDSSALVVVQRSPDLFIVSDVVELIPGRDKPLVPGEVVRDFAGVVQRYQADYIVADGHYRESIAEHLNAYSLALNDAPDGALGKSETHQVVRALLHEGKLRLPNHDRLLRQLHELVSKPTPGGGISITSPRWRTGGHGDLVSALVLAVWDAARKGAPDRPQPVLGPREHAARQWQDRIAATLNRPEDTADGFGPGRGWHGRDDDGFSDR